MHGFINRRRPECRQILLIDETAAVHPQQLVERHANHLGATPVQIGHQLVDLIHLFIRNSNGNLHDLIIQDVCEGDVGTFAPGVAVASP